MKTFPAIYIKEGVVKYNLFPEEPELCIMLDKSLKSDATLGHISCDILGCRCDAMQEAYQKALAAAKQSAITFRDQDHVKQILWHRHPLTLQDGKKWDVAPGTYPLPEGWRVEVKEACSCDSCPSDARCEYCQQPVKVAVLIPPSQINLDRLGNTDRPVFEGESQEEIWMSVVIQVSQQIDRLGASKTVQMLMEQFTIQRRP